MTDRASPEGPEWRCSTCANEHDETMPHDTDRLPGVTPNERLVREATDRASAERLREAIDAALHELGEPGPGYPAPVANAVDILRAALLRIRDEAVEEVEMRGIAAAALRDTGPRPDSDRPTWPSMTRTQRNEYADPARDTGPRPDRASAEGLLSRDNPRSRWHAEQVTSGYRQSWSCIPLTDAVEAAALDTGPRPDSGTVEPIDDQPDSITVNGHMFIHVAACPCERIQAEVARLSTPRTETHCILTCECNEPEKHDL